MASLVAGLMKQRIDYIYSISADKRGDKTSTLQHQDVQCRWVERINKVVNSKGEEVQSVVEVWLLPRYTDIRHNWKITKDDEDYYIVAIENKRNLGGNLDHIKLYLV